jgi:hypothetical protein
MALAFDNSPLTTNHSLFSDDSAFAESALLGEKTAQHSRTPIRQDAANHLRPMV